MAERPGLPNTGFVGLIETDLTKGFADFFDWGNPERVSCIGHDYCTFPKRICHYSVYY